MQKEDIINFLQEIASCLELLDENPFKIRAYQKAIEIIDNIEGEISQWIESDQLFELKGIGPSISDKIKNYYYQQDLTFYYDLKKRIPQDVFKMLKIPSLGPKKVRTLWTELNITTINELKKSCRENKLVSLKGFGEQTQNKILKGIEFLEKFDSDFLITDALLSANNLIEYLKTSKIFSNVELAGSLRRYKELVKDIDILTCVKDNNAAVETIIAYPSIEDIISKGTTKVSIKLKTGINVDIRIVKELEFPYALHHFTGSKEHNTAMRQRAKKFNLKMNEYGLFRVDETLIKCKTETELFKKLNLQFIEPELRENRGEIEAAETHSLAHLITEEDICGLFHFHTNYSDGTNTLEDYIKWAVKNNIKYIGVADHSKSAFYAKGLVEDEVKREWEEIDKLNQKYNQVKILKGIESDILEEGSLDYSDTILEKFDFIIGSVHTLFNLDEERMTERIIRAIKNPYLKILGHLTGRLLKEREGYKVNIEKIIEELAENNKCIEFNANPVRLDLDWRYLKQCKLRNIKIVISTDAHKVETMDCYKLGVKFCRKGWLEKSDVINTYNADEIKKFFLF